MKVLVTGANGLLGHHIVCQLHKLNFQVTALVRSTKELYFNLENVCVLTGDFTQGQDVGKAMEGMDAIIHVAARTGGDSDLDDSDFERINVSATEQILVLAEKHAIHRIVFISTSNTVGFGSKSFAANESTSFSYPFTNSFYAQSKQKAELLVMNYSQLPNKHYVVLNPCFMIGAMDTKPSSGKLILMGYKKPLLFVPRGGKNFVPARDVAVAACNALTMGRNGERYLLGNTNLSFKEFFSMQSQIGGYKQFCVTLPNFMLQLAGLLGDVMRKLNYKTKISSININQLLVTEYYSSQKAIQELDFPQSSIGEAIREAIEWFRQKGKLV